MSDDKHFLPLREGFLEKQHFYEVSRTQERVYTAQGMLPEEDPTYIFSTVIKASKPLDETRIREVIGKLIKRHEGLRASFHITEDGLFQKIHDPDDEIWIEDAAYRTQTASGTVLREIKWDLSSAPLFRWEYEDERLTIHWHHIINDGTGASRFAYEFALLYNGEEPEAPKLFQKEYASWENEWVNSTDYEERRRAWASLLKGFEESRELRLPADGAPNRERTREAGHLYINIPKELSDKANALCTVLNVTPYVLFMSFFSILLNKYTGQGRFIIGTVMRGRETELLLPVIGMFVTTVPIPVHMNKDELFSDFVDKLKNSVRFARDNQLTALEDIASDFGAAGGVERTLHEHLMFDVLFTKKDYVGKLPPIGDAEAELSFIDEVMPMYDLTLQMAKVNNTYEFDFEYDQDVFDEACISEMGKHYVNLICAGVDNPQAEISGLSMLDEEERSWLLLNGRGRTSVSDETTVVERIGKQVLLNPGRKALRFKDEVMTYKELWDVSGKLAQELLSVNGRKAESSVERTVVLISKRGTAMIVALLGILRSGAGYVPVSPEYPDERILYLLRDSKPDCVLVYGVKLSDNILNILAEMKLPLLNVDMPALDSAPCVECLPRIKPEQIAYMIYTSGTTGEPKGVIVEHRQLSALLNAYEDIYDLSKEDAVLQFANYVFDQSVWEIFHILTKGGTLCIASQEQIKDPDKLEAYCEKCSVTVLMMTPGYLKLLNAERFTSLRLVDVGGEAPSRSLLEEWSRGGRTVLNTYGPTETTVNASSFVFADKGRICDKNSRNGENVPIGKPAPGLEIYILNGNCLCGIGVPGELCIGGKQVARGYHDREKLTAERFTVNPFGEGRLYRSGDLARVLPDGNILFMNRIDDQIKIRGFRIELGEIESAIRSLDSVDNAVVVLRNTDGGDKLLCGYYTVKDNKSSLDAASVREALEKRLPDYMIPSVLAQINGFKLTINGKIDRRALPAMSGELLNAGGRREFVVPSTNEEKDCLEAFKRILGTEGISVNDDFLAIGGDSIKAIRIVSILREMGYGIDAPELLRSRTIRGLASHITREESKTYSEYTAVTPTPVMRIFAETDLANPSYYNQSSILTINGQTDVGSLEHALNALIYCHGMLRMISDEKGSIKIRDRRNFVGLKLNVYSDKDETEREEIMNRLHASLDPAKGLVMGAALFKGGEKDRLFLTFHHYVIDEVSWSIIISDLNILYAYALNTSPTKDNKGSKGYSAYMKALPVSSVSFGEWSEKLWMYKELEAFEHERRYWSGIHDEFMATAEDMRSRLASELEKSDKKSTGSQSLSLNVDKDISDALFELARKRYGTRVDAIMIAALARAVSGDDPAVSTVIQLESHGRGNIDQGIICDRTVGWFTAVFPVVVRGFKDIDEQIIGVKELLAGIPNAGIGYGLLFDDLAEAEGLVFNYLGTSETGYDGLISRSDEYSGINVDPRNIEPGTVSFNIRSEEHGLNVECVFDDIYDKNRVHELVLRFAKTLENIVQRISEDTRIYTPSDVCINRLLNEEEWKTLTALYPPQSIETVAELTPLQQGMLYRYLADPGSVAYLLQDRLTIRGDWSRELFETAMRAAFIRFDALRIRFVYKGLDEPVQVILSEDRLNIDIIEISGKSFAEIAADDLRKGIDPAAENMLRVTFNRDSEKYEEKELLITTHHCIIDGWSFPILTDTLMNYYRMLLNGVSQADLLRIAEKEGRRECSYADFLRNRSSLSYADKLGKWKEYLEEFSEGTGIEGIGCGAETESVQTHGTAEYEVLHIDKSMEESIRRYTEKHRITQGCFFGCVWGLLLGFENGVEDVVFGETVSGRDRNMDGLTEAVGMFINTIPVRIKWSSSEYVSDVFRQRQEDYYTMQSAADAPLDKIMSGSDLGSGLIRTLYVYENYPGSDQDERDHTVTLMHEEVDYPVSIGIGEGNGFTVTLQYDGTKYARRYIRLLLARYENIAAQIVSGKDLRISGIDRLSQGEKELMLGEISGITGLITKDTVLDMISRRVKEAPDRKAIIFKEVSLSYGELWNASCILAERIGYGEERFAVLYADRGPGMIIAMLASFLAGAAYVPVDPGYPDERIRFILEDCNASVVLRCINTGTEDREGLFRESGVRVIDVSEEVYDTEYAEESVFHEFSRLRNRLAYMIYTSGTTGEPKGVEIEHTALAQMIHSNIEYYGAFDSRVLLAANYIFDASVQEIFVTLVSGGTLCIIPRDVIATGSGIAHYCREKGVRILIATNALLQALDPTEFDDLKLVCAGGDAANAATFADWYGHTESLVNDYGPTEACVNATVHLYKREDKDPIPVGKPYYNKKIYVLQGQKLCGIGQIGEICIGGTGLARGYHNRPELSRRVFEPNPFGEGRIYRTGDLGVFGIDGELRFVGRNDDQIKIRGYRIETGEIESRIRKYAKVREVAVVSRKKGFGEAYLAAYIVWKDKEEPDGLRAFLMKELPSYMVPSTVVSLDRLPLTTSGKLDVRALPEPVRAIDDTPAEGYFEQIVAELFKKILGVGSVGRNDSFFELGGSSIDMMKLISGLSAYNIGIGDVTAAPTPALLGERMLSGWNSFERRNDGIQILRDGDPDLPSLFCIPPSGGMSLCYLPLIKELSHRGRIYGLTDSKYVTFKDMSFSELAAFNPSSENLWDETVDRYVDNISAVFKDGDMIMGYSQGGAVAQIIACRLEGTGSKVGRLIMLEALPPDSEEEDDKSYLNRDERLRTSAALFMGTEVTDKYRPVDDHVSDMDYLKICLSDIYGGDAADSMLHLLYETYLVYSSNVLNPIKLCDISSGAIDCILLNGTEAGEEGQYCETAENPWDNFTKKSGESYTVSGSFDNHLIFLSKYRKLISDIVNDIIMK